MVDIIKLYNHKKEYIIQKNLRIHSNSYTSIGSSIITDETLREVNSHLSFSRVMESIREECEGYSINTVEKCRRLLDLYG